MSALDKESSEYWIRRYNEVVDKLSVVRSERDALKVKLDAVVRECDRYDKADWFSRVHDRVTAILCRLGVPRDDQLVEYSAYDCDEAGEPVDNLDEVPVSGKYMIKAPADEFYGGEDSRGFRAIVEGPSWLGLCVVANRMILTTGDRHHCYLEGIRQTGRVVRGLPVYRLVMGS